MESASLSTRVLFHIGFVPISETVVTTWIIIAVLVLASYGATRKLSVRPGLRQALIELVVTGIAGQIEDATKRPAAPFLPLIATLFIFLVVANLSLQLPSVNAPTASLETAAALALIVFFAGHGQVINLPVERNRPPMREGFLVPYEAPADERRDEQATEEVDEGGTRGGLDDATAPEKASARRAFLPSSIGLSVLVPAQAKTLRVRLSWGEYASVPDEAVAPTAVPVVRARPDRRATRRPAAAPPSLDRAP